ncbi:MAG: helix-turn-helix transcriptional regulator [Candidatus Faecousia sp.]|nr:helix-turn-helix transcriptional regulator [Candidatus Faecousia sp.]
MQLNEKIFQCRKRCGLSQQELADRLGVSRQAVSKWELGTALPELDKLKLLAGVFGVSADWLLDETQDAPPAAEAEAQPDPACHAWVDDVPGVIGRLLRRYGWLVGVYIAVAGAAMTGMGVLVRYLTGRMFLGFGGDFSMPSEMAEMAKNNPVSVMGTVFFVLGAALFLAGVVLAIVLRRRRK